MGHAHTGTPSTFFFLVCLFVSQVQLKDAKLAWDRCRKDVPIQVIAEILPDFLVPTARLDPQLFPHRPKISILLQYFKRPKSIENLVNGYMRCNMAPHTIELLVNVDNAEEHTDWVNRTYASQGFVVPVFSNNLHEIRGYNRLAGMARGEILLLVQDDRVSPKSCDFYRNLTTLYEKWPKLGAVGMQIGRFRWAPPNTRSRRATAKEDFAFTDLTTGILFQFVALADFGPYAVRRSAYIDVGGLDEGMSEAGQCGIFSDFDLSMRLWAAGYQVGLIYTPQTHQFGGDGQSGGTHKGKMFAQCWIRNLILGDLHFRRRFSEESLLVLGNKVNVSNHELLAPSIITALLCKLAGGAVVGCLLLALFLLTKKR